MFFKRLKRLPQSGSQIYINMYELLQQKRRMAGRSPVALNKKSTSQAKLEIPIEPKTPSMRLVHRPYAASSSEKKPIILVNAEAQRAEEVSPVFKGVPYVNLYDYYKTKLEKTKNLERAKNLEREKEKTLSNSKLSSSRYLETVANSKANSGRKIALPSEEKLPFYSTTNMTSMRNLAKTIDESIVARNIVRSDLSIAENKPPRNAMRQSKDFDVVKLSQLAQTIKSSNKISTTQKLGTNIDSITRQQTMVKVSDIRTSQNFTTSYRAMNTKTMPDSKPSSSIKNSAIKRSNIEKDPITVSTKILTQKEENRRDRDTRKSFENVALNLCFPSKSSRGPEVSAGKRTKTQFEVPTINYYKMPLIESHEKNLLENDYFSKIRHVHFQETLQKFHHLSNMRLPISRFDPKNQISLIHTLTNTHIKRYLFLDLDETLVYCSAQRLNDQAFAISIPINPFRVC